VAGFATLGALIAFLEGAVLIIPGATGAYAWRIFDEVITRPKAVEEPVY
jgi:hypothetical protein